MKGSGGRAGVDPGGRLHVSRNGPHHYRRPRRGPEDRHLESGRRVSQSERPAAARAVRAGPAGSYRRGERPAGAAKGRHRNTKHQGRLRCRDDNKVALRTVTLGDRVGPDYIVTDGVKADERIIIEGLQKVRPGMIVNPTEQAGQFRDAAREKGTLGMARFFIHRPVFAIVISLIILIAGGLSIFSLPSRAISADLAPYSRSRNQLSRRQCRNRGAIHRDECGSRSQRRREHDLHVFQIVERRPLRADVHVQSRRESRLGERRHQQPGEQGHCQTSTRKPSHTVFR